MNLLNEVPLSEPVPTRPAEPEEWRLAPSSNWPVSPEPQGMLQEPQESREELVSWEVDYMCGWGLEVREKYVVGECWNSFVVSKGGWSYL